VRWEGYGPEDDTWEPLKNLKNVQGALRTFKARGWATKGGEYHVTASVTEEIRKRRNELEEGNFEPGQAKTHEPIHVSLQLDEQDQEMNHRRMTQEK
jgi:hypothetical protein